MIGDRVRTEAYARALQAVVRPHSAVLDIGTGTGILALLACRAGARRVYALETSDAIHLARELATASGFAERVEFLQRDSIGVELPEQVDVVVSDLHGILPLFRAAVPALADARKRLLAPGGVLIPRRETLWTALGEAPATYERRMAPWEENSFGFQLQPARRVAANNWWKPRHESLRILTEPRCWATLDYATIENPNAAAEIELQVESAGTAHGVVIWFDSELSNGVSFSNRPGAGGPTIYGCGFFPLKQPVPLEAGDQVHLSLRADLVGDDYVWSWNTTITGGAAAGRVKAKFAQSTFNGEFRSPDTLRRGAANFVPRLDEDGEIERFVLSRMDGKTSLEEISSALAEKYPGRFPSWQDALSRVAELSRRYSR